MRSYFTTFLVLLVLFPTYIIGEWPTEIDSAVDFQWIHYGRFLPDGRGGSWVAGENYFGDIFLTRITREGELITGSDWITIGGLYDGQFSSGMIMSEDSCLILAFCQYDYIEGNVNPKGYGYLQKIDLDGNKLWPEGGVLVTTEQSSIAFGLINGIPELCTDQQGGAYVSWLDYRWNGIFPAIFSQHVWNDGSVDWTPGGKVILDYIDEEYTYIFATPDTQFVTGGWFNARDEYFYFKVNALGDTLLRVENLSEHQGNLKAIDAENNFYYLDRRSTDDVRVHKRDGDGNSLWGENGVLLVPDSLWGSSLRQGGYGINTYIDAAGGFIYPWPHDNKVYLQWIDPEGTPYFDSIQQVSTNARRYNFCLTDSNHVMFVQNIVTGNTMQVYSQRISNEGIWEWPDPTVVHIQANQPDYMLGPDNVSDGNGGQIVFFQYAFLKAKQVSRDGTIGDITVPVVPYEKPFIPEDVNCKIYPNPTNYEVVFNLEAVPLGHLTLRVYNLRGQLVMKQGIVNLGKSINISLDDSKFTSGTYIARIDDGNNEQIGARFTLIK